MSTHEDAPMSSSTPDDGPPDVSHVTAAGDNNASPSVEEADTAKASEQSIDDEHHMEVEDQQPASVKEPEKQAEPEAELLPENESVQTEKQDETENDQLPESEPVPTEKPVETELLAAESVTDELPEQSEPDTVPEKEAADESVQPEEKADESEAVENVLEQVEPTITKENPEQVEPTITEENPEQVETTISEENPEQVEPTITEENPEEGTGSENAQEPERTTDQPLSEAVTSDENVCESVEDPSQNEPEDSVETPCEDVSMTEGVDEAVNDVEMLKSVDNSGDAKETTENTESMMTQDDKTSTDTEMMTEELPVEKNNENAEKSGDVENQEKSAQNEEKLADEEISDKETVAKISEESSDAQENEGGKSNVESTSDSLDNKLASDGESVIEISAVSGNVDVDMVDETSKDADGGLKIASVTSVPDDEVIQILDDAGNDKDKADENVATKKPMLKLASFADLGQNGISDSTPMTSEGVNQCGQCSNKVDDLDNSLMWEAMLFCNVNCLADYQQKMSNCVSCKKAVVNTSLGKYCVRFGSNIKQFCSNACLEDLKKGLKVCFYCQRDITGGDGFLAPIGDKGQFKDFCFKDCLQKYEEAHCGKPIEKETSACAVCSEEKTVEVYLLLSKDRSIKLCNPPCLSAYKFGNNVESSPCDLCAKEMDIKNFPFKVIHVNGKTKRLCSQTCYNVFIFQNREIVLCTTCKVKKYNYDMIEKMTGETISSSTFFCSVNCFQVHTNKAAGGMLSMPQTGGNQWNGMQQSSMPVIQSVSSLAGTGELPARPDRLPTEPVPPAQIQQQVQIQTQTITQTVKETMVKFPEAIEMKNKATMAKPFMHTKGVSCRPHPCHKSTQTEGPSLPVIAPVGVPLYMPVPTAMYQRPYPVPVPIPIPIPVPVFIPTTRNSARGIMKQIKKIRSKLPADPFEAELLAMAGALVDKDKSAPGMSDEDSEDSVDDDRDGGWDDYGAQDVNDVVNSAAMQMQNAPDLECDIKADRVVPKPLPQVTPDLATSPQPFGYNRQQVPAVPPSPVAAAMAGRQHQQHHQLQQMRGQATKRRYSSREDGEDEEDENSPWRQRQPEWDRRTATKPARGRNPRAKQARTDISRDTSAVLASMNKPPEERPDAKHHLKFTYGVNAWKHWVVGKNAELEKARAQGRYMKPFETDILKLRADELNYTLCMFVKEVKKPNGDAYAPDSILYLTLGIQEYLFENGRIDNIFMDAYYEPFTSALHDVVKDFRLPVNELGYFVTRIEEEHLWESKQLGAHSPQVLLNTLVYFNTKYFMLKCMDDHSKLSFTHIMKHWKKGNTLTPVGAKAASNSPGSQGRTVLLRYYPPPNKVGSRHDERKCYEQHENSETPLRCPVKLYEFYLSKCPESMKSRSDMFYLQPERSCVPDSPVWYTASSLSSHQLDKMLQRIIMVREVQEHMLADAS